MNFLQKKIVYSLSSNTLWIFATLFLFISYLLLLSINGTSILSFIGYFLLLAMLFLPVLIFATWRKYFQLKLSSSTYKTLWLYCFILHPFFLASGRAFFLDDLLLIANLKTSILSSIEFILTIGGVVLLTEIALQINKQQLDYFREIKWVKRLSFEESLWLIMMLVSFIRAAFFCINSTLQEEIIDAMLIATTIFKTLSYTIQLFLTTLVYYFFYYVNRYFLMPSILKKKGVIYYGFSIAAIILIFYPIFIFFIRLLPVVYEMNLLNYASNQNLFASDSGGGPFIIILFSLPIIISIEWFRQTSEISNLEKEKSITELNFLKQQINPHFFFNTLNNLYALSITKDPQTPEVVLQLSELMRYVIYKGKEEETYLKDELKYIEDYVQLQRIRIHKKLDFQFIKEVEDEKIRIPPLLFIILIENAFKHGIEPAEENCFLHLHLKTKNGHLFFTCENSFEASSDEAAAGIGLRNLRRRLALRFPDRHELEINQTTDRFKVNLRLDLV